MTLSVRLPGSVDDPHCNAATGRAAAPGLNMITMYYLEKGTLGIAWPASSCQQTKLIEDMLCWSRNMRCVT